MRADWNDRQESSQRKHQPGPKKREVKKKKSHKASFSPSTEKTSSKGVFVLLNDHTICSVFAQTVPGSADETDSAPKR